MNMRGCERFYASGRAPGPSEFMACRPPARPRRVAFAFAPAAGHVNPTLPLVKELASSGHEVHYFGHELLRAVAEPAGAIFHANAAYYDAFSSVPPGPLGVHALLMDKHGTMPDGSGGGNGRLALGASKVDRLVLEAVLPGTLRFLDEVKPHVVVYDALLLCRDAFFAARLRGIPTVSFNTCAGPYSLRDHLMSGVSPEEWVSGLEGFGPHVAVTKRLNSKYALGLPVVEEQPLLLEDADVHMVTTTLALQDPPTPRLKRAYEAQGSTFAYVGPLLDEDDSAVRVGGDAPDRVLEAVREAQGAGRSVVLVSMGTVLTSDVPITGWNGRPVGADGRPRGLSGKELCQSAWGGVFDSFGVASEADGPLIVVSLGNRTDALEGLEPPPPPNALCVGGVPQAALLKLGVDVFLTHGGQNSFMEALASGTPVVVCPGGGDQIVNADKAAAMGAGLKVPRPDAELGQQAEAAARYRQQVRQAVREVLEDPSFRQAAERCAAELSEAGGVKEAARVIVKVASSA